MAHVTDKIQERTTLVFFFFRSLGIVLCSWNFPWGLSIFLFFLCALHFLFSPLMPGFEFVNQTNSHYISRDTHFENIPVSCCCTMLFFLHQATSSSRELFPLHTKVSQNIFQKNACIANQKLTWGWNILCENLKEGLKVQFLDRRPWIQNLKSCKWLGWNYIIIHRWKGQQKIILNCSSFFYFLIAPQ